MDAKTYQELIELIEGQRNIINQQANTIKDLLNQCAEQENMINVLMTVEQVPIPYQDEVRERLEENKIEGDKE